MAVEKGDLLAARILINNEAYKDILVGGEFLSYTLCKILERLWKVSDRASRMFKSSVSTFFAFRAFQGILFHISEIL